MFLCESVFTLEQGSGDAFAGGYDLDLRIDNYI